MVAAAILVVTSHGAFLAQRILSRTYRLTEQAVCDLLMHSAVKGYRFRNYPHGDGISLAQRGWFEGLLSDHPFGQVSYQPARWDDHQDVPCLRCAAVTTTCFECKGLPAHDAAVLALRD